MRLIDADTLMEKEYSRLREGEVLHRIPPSHVDATPTIDAVPVVRCHECTKSTKGGANYVWCHGWGYNTEMPLDGFCSKGHRKEADYD